MDFEYILLGPHTPKETGQDIFLAPGQFCFLLHKSKCYKKNNSPNPRQEETTLTTFVSPVSPVQSINYYSITSYKKLKRHRLQMNKVMICIHDSLGHELKSQGKPHSSIIFNLTSNYLSLPFLIKIACRRVSDLMSLKPSFFF